MRTALLLLGLALVSCGGPKIDSHYPPRPENCDVKLFHGKVMDIVYDDIGHVDSICGNDMRGGIDQFFGGEDSGGLPSALGVSGGVGSSGPFRSGLAISFLPNSLLRAMQNASNWVR